jgi:glutathione peroxidase
MNPWLKRVVCLGFVGVLGGYGCGKDKPSMSATDMLKQTPTTPSPFWSLEVETPEGQTQTLEEYRGKTLLVVNTASECGYTPQYAQLQSLYARFKDKGFYVLAFPSNDYGGQEPGSSAEAHRFAQEEYGVTFPVFGKVKTKGPKKHPLFNFLTEQTPSHLQGEISWNFEKFIIAPNGHLLTRFKSGIEPTDDEVADVLAELLGGG